MGDSRGALSINTLSEGSSCQKSFLTAPALKRAAFEAAARPAAALTADIAGKRSLAVYADALAVEGELGPHNAHLLPVPIVELPIPQSRGGAEWFVQTNVRALQFGGARPIEECLVRLVVSRWIILIGIISKERAADVCPPRLAFTELGQVVLDP